MKNSKFLVAFLFTIFVFAASAAAQGHSLHDLHPGDKFVSEDGFEIALPAAWVKTDQLQHGHRYSWIVTEGSIVVTIRESSDADAIKSDADVAAFLKGYKESLVKDPGVVFFAEVPVKIGEYRGAAYNVTVDGEKTQFIVLVWGKFSIVLFATAHSKVAGSAELISDALKTFALVNEK
jgi:hypothetical protein